MKMTSKLGLLSMMMTGIGSTNIFSGNDMYSNSKSKLGKQCALDGSKPSKRRSKTKLARKANLKRLKRK